MCCPVTDLLQFVYVLLTELFSKKFTKIPMNNLINSIVVYKMMKSPKKKKKNME